MLSKILMRAHFPLKQVLCRSILDWGRKEALNKPHNREGLKQDDWKALQGMTDNQLGQKLGIPSQLAAVMKGEDAEEGHSSTHERHNESAHGFSLAEQIESTEACQDLQEKMVCQLILNLKSGHKVV